MLATLRRLAVLAVWTLGGFGVWCALLYSGLRFLVYCMQRYHWRPLGEWMPEWPFWVFVVVSFVFATGGPLVLGLYGRLPGTRESSHLRRRRGFPVEPTAPAPRA